MKRSSRIHWLRAWCLAALLSALVTLGAPAGLVGAAFAEEVELPAVEAATPQEDDAAANAEATADDHEQLGGSAQAADVPAGTETVVLPTDAPHEAEAPAVEGDESQPAAAEGAGQPVATEADSPATEEAQPAPVEQAVEAQPVEEAATLVEQDANLPKAPKGAVAMEEKSYIFQSLVAGNRVAQADGAKPKAGANVATAAYTGKANQQWLAQREGDSLWYRLYVNTTGDLTKVLAAISKGAGVVDVSVADAAATEKKDLLSMLWAFVSVDGSSYRIVNAAWEGMCLDVAGSKKAAGTNLALKKTGAKTAKNQRFAVIKRYPKVAAGDAEVTGAYLLNLAGTNLVAGVDGASKDAANVAIMAKTGSGAQRVYLERNASGFYTAWIVGTGKVLTAASSSVLPGSNVSQQAYKGNALQQWALTQVVNEDGSVSYRLQNKKNGLYLGGVGTTAGANVAGLGEGAANRNFSLVASELMDKGIYLIHPSASAKLSVQVHKSSTGTAKLVLAANSDALSQRFELVPVDGATDLWRVRTASSGGWVTWTSGSKVVQTGNGATGIVPNNTWRAVWVNGGIVLVNVASEHAGTPLALDTSYGRTKKGTKLVARTSNGCATQHFVFVATQLLGEGYYFLKSAGGRYVQVKDTSAKNDANIQMGSRTGTMGQLFKVEYKKGYSRIYNIYSKKYLQAVDKVAGANVVQRKAGKSKLQRWTGVIMDGGMVVFVNAANKELVLTADSHGKKKNANVKVDTMTNDNGQLWKPVTLSDYVNKPKTKLEKKAIKWAKKTPSPGGGLCAAWVSYVFANAGIGSWGGDACDQYRSWCKKADLTKLRPGMIIAVSSHGHTSAGSIWGHVGIYIGNGTVMDNVGYIRKISLFEWISWYGDRVTPKWGWIGKKKLS